MSFRTWMVELVRPRRGGVMALVVAVLGAATVVAFLGVFASLYGDEVHIGDAVNPADSVGHSESLRNRPAQRPASSASTERRAVPRAGTARADDDCVRGRVVAAEAKDRVPVLLNGTVRLYCAFESGEEGYVDVELAGGRWAVDCSMRPVFVSVDGVSVDGRLALMSGGDSEWIADTGKVPLVTEIGLANLPQIQIESGALGSLEVALGADLSVLWGRRQVEARLPCVGGAARAGGRWSLPSVSSLLFQENPQTFFFAAPGYAWTPALIDIDCEVNVVELRRPGRLNVCVAGFANGMALRVAGATGAFVLPLAQETIDLPYVPEGDYQVDLVGPLCSGPPFDSATAQVCAGAVSAVSLVGFETRPIRVDITLHGVESWGGGGGVVLIGERGSFLLSMSDGKSRDGEQQVSWSGVEVEPGAYEIRLPWMPYRVDVELFRHLQEVVVDLPPACRLGLDVIDGEDGALSEVELISWASAPFEQSEKGTLVNGLSRLERCKFPGRFEFLVPQGSLRLVIQDFFYERKAISLGIRSTRVQAAAAVKRRSGLRLSPWNRGWSIDAWSARGGAVALATLVEPGESAMFVKFPAPGCYHVIVRDEGDGRGEGVELLNTEVEVVARQFVPIEMIQ